MTATLSTEDGLQAALDADPANHLLRYALADCLDESAGEVGCPKCKDERFPGYFGSDSLADAFSIELKNRWCDRCSGTGRVSDGRRERAEGLRVLAQLGLVPGLEGDVWVWYGASSFYDLPGDLPDKWRAAINQPYGNGARYPTRREAEDNAALAWGTLPADVRAAILGAGAGAGPGPHHVRGGGMTATTLSTEDALSAALDADPGNHLLRYALADCLEESAGTVDCGRCGGEDHTRDIGPTAGFALCHRCSGTGRVSDGRRERAEGLRVLAQLGRVPDSEGGQWVWWGQGFAVASGKAGRWYPTESADSLPWEWRQAVNGDRWEDETNGARYPTRREAEGAAALAWPTLPAETRAKILGAA